MVNDYHLEFSEMEQKIIEELRYGNTNKDIAKKLNFSSYAIKYHIAKIIHKTNAVNRINAVYILTKNGYFENHVQEDELS